MEKNESMNVTELAEHLSDISRNTGKITFKVTYTATDGNMDVHKAFQKFCFEKANNEYLAGIGKLLEFAEIFAYLISLDERLQVLEKGGVRNGVQEEVGKKEEVNDTRNRVKTF